MDASKSQDHPRCHGPIQTKIPMKSVCDECIKSWFDETDTPCTVADDQLFVVSHLKVFVAVHRMDLNEKWNQPYSSVCLWDAETYRQQFIHHVSSSSSCVQKKKCEEKILISLNKQRDDRFATTACLNSELIIEVNELGARMPFACFRFFNS